jgi:hypothetical protein
MQPLRRAVQFFFGVQALGLLGTLSLVLGAFVAWWRHVPGDEMPVATYWLMIVSSLIGFLLNTVPAIAWRKLKRGRPSARPWAIAASILNILVLVAGIDTLRHSGRTSTWPISAVCGAIGLLGLIGYWRKQGRPADPMAARLPGDGTSSAKDYTSQIVSFAILTISFQLWNRWADEHDLQAPGVVAGILLLQLAVLLNTFLHETGHLLAGWASGMILRRFHVGPLLCAVRNGRWKIEFQWKQYYGGSVGMVTPTLKNIRGRQAFMIMGGPVASLVTGAVATTAALSSRGHAWESYWPILSMIGALGWSSFVTNLIPLKKAARYSDGAQLYQIVTGGEWAHFHLAFAMVSSSLVTPIRPRDFDASLLERAAGFITHGEQGLLLRLFLCQHYLDVNQIPEALTKLEAAEVLYDQSTFDKPEDICAEFVFVNAFYKRDLAAAEAWWQRIESLRAIDPDADFWRARTSLLWLRGERKEAREAWAHGHELAQKLPASGVYETTRLCFAQLYNALEQRIPAVPPPLPVEAFAANQQG